jgi:hypothetical protein
MNTSTVSFRCPHCRSRIKAPVQLIGQSRACPGCKQALAVPRFPAEDAGPILVPIEKADRYTLALGPRYGTLELQARTPRAAIAS